jgi:O-antigen/teichoic acid export membrane protein
MTNIDKVLIQLFWSSEEVGYYFSSLRICEFIALAGTSMGTLLFPTISNFHAKKDVNGIKNVLYLSERYISMLTFPMVIGLIALAGPIVNILLSSSFYPAISIFRVLPFFALLYALSIPYKAQFLGMNKPKFARNKILIMVSFNITLNIILIPKDIQLLGVDLFGLGALGAAIATVTSYLIGLIYTRFVAWKLLKIKFNQKILLHIFSATVMGIILYWIDISNFIPIERWYELFGAGLLGLGIYIGVLVILREFTQKDFNFIMDTLSIKKMWAYIIKEIKR